MELSTKNAPGYDLARNKIQPSQMSAPGPATAVNPMPHKNRRRETLSMRSPRLPQEPNAPSAEAQSSARTPMSPAALATECSTKAAQDLQPELSVTLPRTILGLGPARPVSMFLQQSRSTQLKKQLRPRKESRVASRKTSSSCNGTATHSSAKWQN